MRKKFFVEQPSLVNRKGPILLHDNARPHVSQFTIRKTHEFDCETSKHPPGRTYHNSRFGRHTNLIVKRQKPHTSLVTRQKLGARLGYSPDLAPSDFHLFRSMQNSLNGQIFNDADDVKFHLIQFFAGKNHGIMTLPERWQKVIDKNGQYLI
ncbi:Histone-lysine N-methyltransferase SETMAR [Habropoda laboriosa]|uniref:Histone-lysine N-methyltransferase SETMAR n=1 Tax=Habropoda laboriosa TaxID=597456 RepID=A0A0L7QWB9_9HYME|nr:Histone-lysine N-methyltransferase SETMAR [Habropoda laboriosa]